MILTLLAMFVCATGWSDLLSPSLRGGGGGGGGGGGNDTVVSGVTGHDLKASRRHGRYLEYQDIYGTKHSLDHLKYDIAGVSRQDIYHMKSRNSSEDISHRLLRSSRSQRDIAKGKTVALLQVHFEGNVGDQMETIPLLKKLYEWGVVVDCYLSVWMPLEKRLDPGNFAIIFDYYLSITLQSVLFLVDRGERASSAICAKHLS